MHPADQLLASVQHIVGLTRQLAPDGVPRQRWVHGATYRGRAVRVSITGRVKELQGLYLGVSLLQRPLLMWVQLASVDVGGVETLTGAPPGYRGDLAARGNPREVLGPVLFDPAVMQALLARTRGESALFFTEGGWLYIQVEPSGKQGLPSPAVIAAWLDALIDIADRLIFSFDQTHQLIASRQGPEAAAAWLGEQQLAMTRRSSSSAAMLPIIIAVGAAFTILTLAIIFCALLR